MSDSIRLARDCSQVSPPGSPMKMGPSVRVPFSLVAGAGFEPATSGL